VAKFSKSRAWNKIPLGDTQNFLTTLCGIGEKKSRPRQNQHAPSSRFKTKRICDRQTDRQTDRQRDFDAQFGLIRYTVRSVTATVLGVEQWHRVHWARSGLGPTFNPPGGAMSGLVQLLEQFFASCFRKHTSIIVFKVH